MIKRDMKSTRRSFLLSLPFIGAMLRPSANPFVASLSAAPEIKPLPPLPYGQSRILSDHWDRSVYAGHGITGIDPDHHQGS